MLSGRWRALGILAALGLLVPSAARAYVLPAEQIIQLMTANFAKFDTLVIRHTVTRMQKREGPENVFEEVLSIKSPNLFHSSLVDSTAGQAIDEARVYRELLIASSPRRLLPRLGELGVDTQQVGYTRLEGTVVYCIGEKNAKSPKLLIEKARALPLLLIYRRPGQAAGELIRVRFLDYRRVEQGWVPFEVHTFSGDQWTAKYSVHSVKANVPLKPSFFAR